MPNPASAGVPNPVTYDIGNDGVVTDLVSGLVWEQTAQGRTYQRQAALEFCAANRRGGYSDWKLPTRLELLSIVDFTRDHPAIDTSVFAPTVPPSPDTFLWYTWTSSQPFGSTDSGWMVDFTNGHLSSPIVQNVGQVRCVRSPAAPRCYSRRFQPQTGNSVHDASTGLTWQQTLDPRSFNWSEAGIYCAGLGNGFRLPSVKELEIIVDDTRQFPSIDMTAFPNTPSEYFWTSSRWSGLPTTAWVVGFNYADSNGYVDTMPLRVRCVR
jgi:hypothetical protein